MSDSFSLRALLRGPYARQLASADQVPDPLPGHLEDDARLRGGDPGIPDYARLAEHRLADRQVSHIIRAHAPKPDTSTGSSPALPASPQTTYSPASPRSRTPHPRATWLNASHR
jgi:hypothetical protein